MMKYQVVEKINSDFLSKVTGLKKEAIEEVFMIGDTFRIKEKRFKIIYRTKENNEIIFICHVWN
ncbi:hypothetical protein V4D30_00910 [Thermodesulfovibrio sp. 3907-1M]|uniref:Type II toxin-antitoxin system RelE/ParE family toxin n=1 Tax=Thermodesulfovibrio autotrophicus TaxID=3118333 RepID=A0AAU8GW55_9BACT